MPAQNRNAQVISKARKKVKGQWRSSPTMEGREDALKIVFIGRNYEGFKKIADRKR